ncbi:hypothetical protein GA0115246_103276 [Streptomyces sp. SolWspMP-sol7th]|nr:hypothetical protein GA0115246_103276 [Streptomyces sp. SolWspMP-sol7th]
MGEGEWGEEEGGRVVLPVVRTGRDGEDARVRCDGAGAAPRMCATPAPRPDQLGNS